MGKQSVRWWVVALGIGLGWALACFGPRAAEGQVNVVAADSVMLRKLGEFHTAERMDSVIVLDSILAMVVDPPCAPGTTGVIGLAGASVRTERMALHAGRGVLGHFPELLIVCFIHGARWSQFPDGREFLMPEMWCAYREDTR
jgi:hypothetical protein